MPLNPLPSDQLNRPRSPAQSWTYRVPSPPRIVVPPPAINASGLPDLHLTPNDGILSLPHRSTASGFTNTDFLATVTYNNFLRSNAMLDWKYENRRMAQAVLPFLYLGPGSAARDEAWLRREGVTMVLAVRNTLSAQARLLGSKMAESLGCECASVDVAGNQELIKEFPRGIELINAHLSRVYRQGQQISSLGDQKKMGKVLVFCESGNERSASLVVAYVMAMYGKDVVTALQIVQAQRFAVAFDDSLRHLLLTYESILRAKRDVVRADSAENGENGESSGDGAVWLRGGMGGKGKRRLDEADDDIDMDGEAVCGETDFERIEKREGKAPFQN